MHLRPSRKAGRSQGILEFRHDIASRRIGSVEVQERFVHDGNETALVYDGDGTLIRRYLHGPVIDMVLAEDHYDGSTGAYLETYYDLGDHQNSVRDLVTVTGSTVLVVQHVVLDAFGGVALLQDGTGATMSGDPISRWIYTGREYDNSTLDYQFRSRYFTTSSGRFISRDQIGFSSNDTNLYRFVGNSTVNGRDPYGTSFWGGVLQVVGGVLETAAGVGLALSTSASGVGVLAGVAIAAHGIDNILAGAIETFGGGDVDTATSATLQAVGLSRDTANLVDTGIGIAGSIGAGTVTAISKVASVAAKDPAAAGKCYYEIYKLIEKGSKALNKADYDALGGAATTAVEKAIMIEKGVDAAGRPYKLTTTLLQNLCKTIALIPTGPTPGGNIGIGVGGAVANGMDNPSNN